MTSSPLDFEQELLLQHPATTINLSFGRLVCASKASSIRLQPMLCTVFHLAIRTLGASTIVHRRARRPSPFSSYCCSYLVRGSFCNSVLFGGLVCKTDCLI
jgi:hypothetical protein